MRLFTSGISEELVADHIRRGAVTAKPSVADLIYFKENKILEIIIKRGDIFADARQEVGGNENLLRLLDVLKRRFPNLPVVEKLKKEHAGGGHASPRGAGTPRRNGESSPGLRPRFTEGMWCRASGRKAGRRTC